MSVFRHPHRSRLTDRMLAFCAALVLAATAAWTWAAPDPPVRFARITSGQAATDRASTGGVALIDVDGDGDLDLFVTNGYDVSRKPPVVPQIDRFYLNEGRGNFALQGASPLSGDTALSSGQAWGDYDNDGDPDVFVSTQAKKPDLLYRNDGNGTFTPITEGPTVSTPGSSFSASWADVDNDGLIDLLVVNGGLSGRGQNSLYRNLGGGRFEPVTEGDIVTDSSAHMGSAWGDYDNDGDLDLFMGTFSFNPPTSLLYRNDGGMKLTRITEGRAVTDSGPTVGGAWGDYDNDGDLDLAVGTPNGYVSWLYRNRGKGTFERVEDAGDFTLDGSDSFGLVWVDYDNDGDLDLFSANWGAPSVMYTNDGNGHFMRGVHGDLGRLITTASSTSWGDIDRDGDLDLIIGTWPNWPGPLEEEHIYRNDAPPRSWLGVRLVGTRSNRSGIGARVTVRARIGGRDVTQTRELAPNTAFRSHDPLELHFGLGDAPRIDEMIVRWPSGTVQRLGPQMARRMITVTEKN